MALSLWNDTFLSNPWAEMRRLESEMDKMFSMQPSSQQNNNQQVWFRPALDIKESENEYKIHAELPGCKKEDIKLEVHNGQLTISGEKKEEKKEDSDKYHRVERRFGSFSRSIALPEGVTEEQVKAKYDNGVLEVSFPKPAKKETPKPKTININ